MIRIVTAIERFRRYPSLFLESIAHPAGPRARFCSIGEIDRFVREMFGVGQNLADVFEASDDIHSRRWALVDGSFVSQRLVGLIGALLGLEIK